MIELIKELLDNQEIEEIEEPWKDIDNIYVIRTKDNCEVINTTKLNERFNILQITVSAEHQVSIFVEPKA